MRTKDEIESEILDWKEAQEPLLQDKMRIQRQLGDINLRCRSRLPDSEYGQCLRDRKKLNDELMGIEQQLLGIKQTIRRLSLENERAKRTDGTENRSIVEALVELRTEYQKFSGDRTRVESMRVMASEFCQRLTDIIRRSVNNEF